MEPNFTTTIEDIRHEQSLIILLALTDPDLIKHQIYGSKTDMIKNFALESLYRQRVLKEYTALQILEQYFLFNKHWSLQKSKMIHNCYKSKQMMIS